MHSQFRRHRTGWRGWRIQLEARTKDSPVLLMDMNTGKYVLIGLCALVAGLGPFAAETIGADSHGRASTEPLRLVQQMQLSAPRAVQVKGLAVGDRLDPARLHVITRPGLYGLSGSTGDSFGVVDGLLVRYDPASLRLKSIIRSSVTPVD